MEPTEPTVAADSEEKQAGQTAVYIPFKTFQTSLDVFAEGLPPKLDRSAWPTFSGVVRGQVLSAYKFLGLVDKDGIVQPVLKDLVASKDAPEAKGILGVLLRNRYPRVAELGLQNGTIQNLQDALRELKVSGSTLEKAIRFWVDGAKFAGVRHPVTWEKIPRSISNPKSRKANGGSKKKLDGSKNDIPEDTDSKGGQESTKTVTLHGARVTLVVEVDNYFDLAASTDMKWFQELLTKFNEKEIQPE